MGFLKRIFSIGSKKNKKRPQIVHNVDARLRAIEEEEHEAAVGRLLRSSSARYAVVSEADYSSMPPLPHPINDVIPTPTASTISIASSSVSQRGTYNVTVHKRKQHTLTEFPNANRDLDNDPAAPLPPSSRYSHLKENSQLLGLRSDPSVVSLLDMYDEHGRISSNAFSNSPPTPLPEGRAQTRRTGSTLRQLLGNPSSLSSKTGNEFEGDISWAERFLGESDSVSSRSSLDLGTPNTPNAHFLHNSTQRNNARNGPSLAQDHDLSIITYEYPTISSMQVELSVTGSLLSFDQPSKDQNPYGSPDPTTPQRASQVFGFLTEKRRSKFVDDADAERSLPELPSAFSFSEDGLAPTNEECSHFSSDDSLDSTVTRPAIPIHNEGDISTSSNTSFVDMSITHDILPSELPSRPSRTPFGTKSNHHGNFSEADVTHHESLWETPNPQQVKVIMTAPTKVIVTAPTPSGKLETPSRIPRGPRSQSRKLSPRSIKKRRPSERSNSTSSQSIDLFTPVLPRRKSHRRTGSSSSISHTTELELSTRQVEKVHRRKGSETRSILTELNKENGKELSGTGTFPSTPMRSKSDSRSLFRAAVNPGMFRPPVGMTPSPASSSELSPVARQLMANVRQQRSRAREVDRERNVGRVGARI